MRARLASGFRFRPPPMEVSTAARWALLRAFGPAEAPAAAVEPEQAWSQAAALGLAPRIGTRLSTGQLTTDLGEGVARRFAAARRAAASTALRYEQLAADLSELAAEREVPLFLLKGVALLVGGHCAPGERPFGDLDCLAPEREARALFAALVERGFRPADAPPNEQHLPPLAAPGWGVVDLHFALRGVWHPSGEWWTAERLLEEGRARPLAALPGTYVPDAEILAAHALVHGIDQHGLAPGRHGLLRVVGDLASLLPSDEDRARFAAVAHPWIVPSVSEAEADAVLTLTRKLTSGELPTGSKGTDPAERLLRHLIAAATDDDYQRAGRWCNVRLRLRRAAEGGHLLRYIRRKLRQRR